MCEPRWIGLGLCTYLTALAAALGAGFQWHAVSETQTFADVMHSANPANLEPTHKPEPEPEPVSLRIPLYMQIPPVRHTLYVYDVSDGEGCVYTWKRLR